MELMEKFVVHYASNKTHEEAFSHFKEIIDIIGPSLLILYVVFRHLMRDCRG